MGWNGVQDAHRTRFGQKREGRLLRWYVRPLGLWCAGVVQCVRLGADRQVMEAPAAIDLGARGGVLSPREVWRLTRPVVWLLPLVYALVGLGWSIASRLGDPAQPLVDVWMLRRVVDDVRLVVGLVLMGVVLVAVGWRRLWVVPLLLFQFGDVARSLETVLIGGAPWSMLGDDLLTVSGPLYRLGWLGGPVLLVVVSIPAFVLLRRRRVGIGHEPFGLGEVAGVGVALVLVGMVTYLAITLAPFNTQLLPLVFKLAPLVVFGAAVGTARGWWPWAHLTVGVLMLHAHVWGPVEFWPVITAALLAGLWPLFARSVDTSMRHPLAMLIGLNVLNLADAVFTRLAVSAGLATELNPLLNGSTGLTVKVLVVAAASVLIYRVRPKLVIWPTLAFVGVTLWHLIGMVLNA